MIFEKVNTQTKEKHYEVADIIQDTVNGYERSVITLGNVSTKTTTIVAINDLNNPRHWKSLIGAEVIVTTEVVKKISFMDGDEKVLGREVINEEKICVEAQPEKTKPTADMCKPYKTIITNNYIDVAQAAKHKQAITGKTNAMTTALAKATTRKKKPKLKKRIEEVPANGIDEVRYDWRFFNNLMNYSYDSLEQLGVVTKGVAPLFVGIEAMPKKISLMVHKQELAAFREDGKTLGQIRAMGNRIKANKPEQVGTPVSPQQILRRILRAFYHFGTNNEKAALYLDN